MRLNTEYLKDTNLTDFVTCVGWLNSDEVYLAGDDHKVVKINQISGDATVVVQLGEDVYATDLHWFPKSIGGKKQGGSEVYALTLTDGRFLFISKNGRVEKTIDAHRGAILSGKWSYDGNALLTAGEDGQVKVWSRSGMLRSTLVSLAVPVYSAVWSPNSDAVLHTNGKQLCIKPLQPTAKQNTWKAHEGIVLKVDWNSVNNLIISGGEDCKYKVWDVYGRQLYTSMAHDYPITSLAWCPNGSVFAIGSYNTLRLCDKSGWSHSLEKPNTGSLFNIAWSNDGTQLCAACGNSEVIVSNVIESRLEWKNFEVVNSQPKHIFVRDVLSEAKENLDFRDRVVKFALAFNHLVVTTPAQCYIYSTQNWNTPMIFDLKSGSVSLIMLAEKHFLLVDDSSFQVYSYEGRLISTPRYNGMRPDLMNEQIVTTSNDTIVIRDRNDEKALYIFEALNGKPVGDGKPVKHPVEIVEISLNQEGSSTNRQLTIIDKNRDLYLRAIRHFGAERVVKLTTMVSSMRWNDTCNILATISDHRLSVWYHPSIAYIDQDLVRKTKTIGEQGEFGKDVHIMRFVNTYCTMRRGDGAMCSSSVSPHPAFLHKYVNEGKWDEALRLCRFVKEDSLWACLAGMAASHKELSTAEIAYAAIEEVEKVQYINFIKEIPTPEGRNAAMAIFCGQTQDAEAILLQSGLIYRAIQMYLDVYNWDRALEIAVKHKTHVDTVLGFRERYMKKCNKKEQNKKFLQFAQGVQVDWEKINAKIEMEIEKESERPNAKPYNNVGR